MATAVLTNGAMANTDVITGTIAINGPAHVGLQLVFTGTPTGTFDFLVSNDGTNFDSLSLASVTAAGAAATHSLNLGVIPFDYLQVKYTNTSGTGTLNAKATVGRV